MTGAETKAQVMEALRLDAERTRPSDDRNRAFALLAALAPCIVLTAEEAQEIRDHITVQTLSMEGCECLALLTPEADHDR